MFWKADSTFDASKAEVSMNESPFSAVPTFSYHSHLRVISILTRKLLRLICRHCPQMLQVALVSNKHNNNIGIRMISQLLEPSRHVLVGLVLGNVVYQECADSTSVVGGGDGSVSFLPSCGRDVSTEPRSIKACRCHDDGKSAEGVRTNPVASRMTSLEKSRSMSTHPCPKFAPSQSFHPR